MAQNSKIEWTDHTANLWWGCTKVHAGCDNCYAETLSHRWDFDLWGNDKPRRAIDGVWKDLAKFQRDAAKAETMHRVFVGSMMDIFEKPMPLVDHLGNKSIDANDGSPFCTDILRDRLFDEITDGKYPNLIFLLLTKRPSNINKMIPDAWRKSPPRNVMFGTSPVDQATAQTLIPQLLQVKGKHFLSVEPQLGPINLADILAKIESGHYGETPLDPFKRIDWIIQGGESGHHRRPFNLEWAYDMIEQCKHYGITYFFKQIDKVLPIPQDLMFRRFLPTL